MAKEKIGFWKRMGRVVGGLVVGPIAGSLKLAQFVGSAGGLIKRANRKDYDTPLRSSLRWFKEAWTGETGEAPKDPALNSPPKSPPKGDQPPPQTRSTKPVEMKKPLEIAAKDGKFREEILKSYSKFMEDKGQKSNPTSHDDKSIRLQFNDNASKMDFLNNLAEDGQKFKAQDLSSNPPQFFYSDGKKLKTFEKSDERDAYILEQQQRESPSQSRPPQMGPPSEEHAQHTSSSTHNMGSPEGNGAPPEDTEENGSPSP